MYSYRTVRQLHALFPFGVYKEALLGYRQFVFSYIIFYKFQSSGKEETTFTRSLKASIREGKPLRVNRPGLVKLSEEAEKPIFTMNKLYRNRQRGLSCKAIAKKMGVDTSKDEVNHISHILKSQCSQVPDIESPYKYTLPTPLWYLCDSELEVIKEGALPRRSVIMAHNPHARIVANLGEDSSWMLQVYLAVQKVVLNEIMYSFQNASGDCPLGEKEEWSNHLA